MMSVVLYIHIGDAYFISLASWNRLNKCSFITQVCIIISISRYSVTVNFQIACESGSQFYFRPHTYRCNGLKLHIREVISRKVLKMPLPKKSPVWADFVVTEKNKAKCQICSAELCFDGSSTSNLLKHLAGVHKKTVGKQQSKSLVDFGVTVAKKCNTTRKSLIDNLVADVVSENSLSFRFVESKTFRNLMTFVEPNYKPLSAEGVKSVIEDKATKLRSSIQEKIRHCRHIALTTDCWTSPSNESFLAVTSSYIDEKWNLCTPVLETRFLGERHFSEYLQEQLCEVINDWSIYNKVVAVVHDNASNIKNIAQSINNSYIDVGCTAHTLQICINNSFGTNKAASTNPIARCINASSRLVGHFSHSTLATNELLKRQKVMNVDSTEAENQNAESEGECVKFKLIQYVKTRWNSVHDMFERLLKLRWPITAVLSDRNVTKLSDAKTLDLTSEQWLLIENLLPTLKKLKIANTLLCGENYVSISTVCSVIKTLIDVHLSIGEDDTPVVKTFKEDLKRNLETKFDMSAESIFLLTSVLDPRYKDMKFIDGQLRENVYETLKQKVKYEIEEDATPTTSVSDPGPGPSAKKPKLQDEEEFFAVQSDRNIDEIAVYLGKEILERKQCPLKWWYSHERELPNLSKLAKQYLCIPATSTASERHFSAAGRTITKTRNRLLPETTDVLLFVNRNTQYKKSSDDDEPDE